MQADAAYGPFYSEFELRAVQHAPESAVLGRVSTRRLHASTQQVLFSLHVSFELIGLALCIVFTHAVALFLGPVDVVP